jgi:chorismate--pyruvate lyase
LGTRPLGELLFTDPAVRRGRTFFFTVQDGTPLHYGASTRAAATRCEFWARASLFYIGIEPILVTEIFLTDGR